MEIKEQFFKKLCDMMVNMSSSTHPQPFAHHANSFFDTSHLFPILQLEGKFLISRTRKLPNFCCPYKEKV